MQKYVYGLYALITLFIACTAQAETPIWQEISGVQARSTESSSMRAYQADDAALRQVLSLAPHENSLDRSQRIQLPLPDGSLQDYILVESPIMHPGLAARFPEIRNYRIYDPADESPRGRLSVSPLGFRGAVDTDNGRVYIDPQTRENHGDVYQSRLRSSIPKAPFRCELHGEQDHRDLENWLGPKMRSAGRVSGSLLKYRIAIAVTNEYYTYFGGNDMDVMTEVNDTIAGVNAIYERDLGITFELVNNNETLFERTDEGLGASASVLLPEVDDWIDSRLPGGDSSYDIGHMFYRAPSLVGGGLAVLGAVCNDDIKAGGVTGLSDPTGKKFYIDYVAHEIGHQFDAEHSFNGTTKSCSTGRFGPSAYEPGSGSTIMGYANLCTAENLQTSSDETFHAGSIAEIDSFTRNGGNCFQLEPTRPTANNRDPNISSISNKSIPALTAFILDGNAADPDSGDTANLTYQWDQMDAGCPTDKDSLGTDSSTNALFRSYLPRGSGESWRNFPTLGTQVRGLYDRAEVLPCQDRKLNFRLTARDNKSGQDFEDLRLNVVKSAGPFRVIEPNTMQDVNAGAPGFLVRWDVADTNIAPISCANVDIDLLTFSPPTEYLTYSIYNLASSTLNDGNENVIITPATASHPNARIRVKCSNNVFYDLSDEDLRVLGAGPDLAHDDFTTRSFVSADLTGTSAPVCPKPVVCEIEADSSSGGGRDSSSIDPWWLLALATLVALVRGYRRYSLQ